MSNQHGSSVHNLRQKSTTKSILFYTKKRIKIASNVQYFAEKYFPAIAECSYVEWMYTDFEYIQQRYPNTTGCVDQLSSRFDHIKKSLSTVFSSISTSVPSILIMYKMCQSSCNDVVGGHPVQGDNSTVFRRRYRFRNMHCNL